LVTSGGFDLALTGFGEFELGDLLKNTSRHLRARARGSVAGGSGVERRPIDRLVPYAKNSTM
jgi:hypothetical protein